MPGTLEPRVVIVDIDSRSLAAIGSWPWPRAELARLVDTLFEQQKIADAFYGASLLPTSVDAREVSIWSPQ